MREPNLSQPSPALVHRYGAVAHVLMHAPASRNSLSTAMLAAIQGALDAISGDDDVRAVVISGDGPCFCSGHDLKELTAARTQPDAGAEFFRATMAACSQLMQTIVALPQPVIAAVEGLATAAGCQLVATCDLAICGDEAIFCTPGVDIGLFCSTPMVALSRNISRKHAMEMLLTGERISAAQAARFGLVNRVVEPGTTLAAALELASTIAHKPHRTVATGKKAFYEQAELTLAKAYEHASRVMTQNLLGAEAIEGLGAFSQKRAPIWPQD